MDANEIIESYVRDVAACLPRARRDDVAMELRALLHEDLAARSAADGAGTAAARTAAATALLKDFGRPAEVAQRYHARAPLVAAADTPHFLIWATGGVVVLVLHMALGHPDIEFGALLLQWLGLLLLAFACIDGVRRRYPGALPWKPSHGLEWMPRGLSALSLACTVVFPVAMYAAPVPFARWLLPDAVPVHGLVLDAAFAGSWQRLLTLGLLVGLAVEHALALVVGSRPAWLRRGSVAVNLLLGVLFVAHASPLHGPGGTSYAVFQSAHANAVAAPVFLALGGMMILFGLYYAWREWSAIRPAPAGGHGAPA